MLRLDLIRDRPVDIALRVMEAEAALFLTAAGFFIAVEVCAPDALCTQFGEAMGQQRLDGFRRNAAAPERFSDPVADLEFTRSGTLGARREKAAAAAQQSVPPPENCERPRCGEHGADDLAAVVCVLMYVPASRRADLRVLCQRIERLCVRFLPRAEQQTRCLKLHKITFPLTTSYHPEQLPSMIDKARRLW